MHVARAHRNGTVPRDPRQRPGVATGLAQARQERVAQAVQHEWRHATLVSLDPQLAAIIPEIQSE
jgi:hypothetical protein